VVNLAGCFLLGGIGQFGLDHLSFPPEWRVAVTVGFFGAFTTFSSFSWETVHLFEDGEWLRACVYVTADEYVSGVDSLFLRAGTRAQRPQGMPGNSRGPPPSNRALQRADVNRPATGMQPQFFSART